VLRRAIFVIACAWAIPAQAGVESAHDEARRAYDLGTDAFQRGDYGSAVALFARADELEANDVALEAALQAVILADDPIVGMRLVERAARRNATADVVRSIDKARRHFAGRTARIHVRCGASSVAVDGAPLELNVPVIVSAGPHRLVVDRAGSRESRDLDLGADRVLDLDLDATVAQLPAPRPPEPEERLLPSVWLAGGSAVTAVLGGATVLSGIDTKDQHDSFVADGCRRTVVDANCYEAARSGAAAERRTNILLGFTIAAGVAALATFAVAESLAP
jgi:hypothetical protein